MSNLYDLEVARIARAARDLNDESDELLAELKDLEARMIETGAGIEYWLSPEGCLLLERIDVEISVAAEPPERRSGWQLGYAKCQGRWCFVIRPFPGPRPSDPNTAPLISASRQTRIEAQAHLAPLLTGIADTIEAYLDEQG